MPQTPRRLSYSIMKEALDQAVHPQRSNFFISHELLVINGSPTAFIPIVAGGNPVVIDDYRIGMLVKGEVRVDFNLIERHLTPGTLTFLAPGTLIQPKSLTPDVEIKGVALLNDFPMPFAPTTMPAAFNGHVRDFQLHPTPTEADIAEKILETIWQVVHQPAYHRPTLSSLVASLMHHYDQLYGQYTDAALASRSNEQTLFDRFIALVNEHGHHEHHIGYYASRMCLTERYLGSVVRQASGVTAKEWIDRATTAQAKVLLLHSNKSVAQIAEELAFPNPSFFSKFFKRTTGTTPNTFRNSRY